MIIQIRGTSGSGKTWVVKEIMKEYDWEPHYVENRKRPLYYTSGDIIVLGHYEIDCGGCDTIGSAPKVFQTIQNLKVPYKVMITEGLLWGEDVKWTVQLEDTVRSLYLHTSLEDCLNNVKKRQGGIEPKDPNRVVRKLSKRIQTISRTMPRLQSVGVYCRRASSNQSVKIIRKWINAV